MNILPLNMKRPFAILLTLVIVFGIPVGITLLTGIVASNATSSVVGVLVGVTFGTFGIDIYKAFLDRRESP